MEGKNNRRISNGSYSIAVTAMMLLAAVLVNCMAEKLPAEYTQFDFSTAKLYTLTETSKTYLESLEENVTLYFICEGGEEDDTISKLLERYEDASPRIHVEQVDPVLYPGFTSQYSEERVGNNSVIVVSDRLHRVIQTDAMYVSDYSVQTGGYVNTAFDGEGQITAAIDYVLSDEVPVFYQLNGNGEIQFTEIYANAVEKNNITLKTLNLLTTEEVPEDASALIISAPQIDYSQKEADLILDYLEKGGRAMIFSNYKVDAMPNFRSILTDFGIECNEGIVLEGDSGYYMTYQYCLLPTVNYTAITANVYGRQYLLMPMSQAILEMEGHRSSISCQPILMTSDTAYAKADVQHMTTSEKEAGDKEGPFVLGMLIEEDIDQNHTYDTEIVYFSSAYLLDEDYNQNVSGGNAELISGTAAYLRNTGSAVIAAVPPKSLQVQYLTLNSFTANLWTVICVILLPAGFLGVGLIIWFRRRRH